MYVEFTREQLCLIARMAEARLAELHSEIRRTQNFRYKAELRAELEKVEGLMHALHEMECDVTA